MGDGSNKLEVLFEQAYFVKEAHRIDQLSVDVGAEIAFVGRSNAGKSSVINRLCRRRSLARTSRTPGRTQQFVVFEMAPDLRIIDLPGFGFAKVSKSKRQHWDRVIPKYLQTRLSLLGLVLVMDARHPLKAEELEIIGWCERAELPVLALLNKVDKLNQKERARSRKIVKREIVGRADLVAIEEFSATSGFGVGPVFEVLGEWFSEAVPTSRPTGPESDEPQVRD